MFKVHYRLMVAGIVFVALMTGLLMLKNQRASSNEVSVEVIAPPSNINNLSPALVKLCETLATDPLAIEVLAKDNENLRSVETYDLAQIDEGAFNYSVFCANCHGAMAEGVDVLGPPLVQNVFVRGMNDEALVRFVQHGRPANDPFTISGVEMPARAGFPNLTDVQIQTIVMYLRVLDVQQIAGDGGLGIDS